MYPYHVRGLCRDDIVVLGNSMLKSLMSRLHHTQCTFRVISLIRKIYSRSTNHYYSTTEEISAI